MNKEDKKQVRDKFRLKIHESDGSFFENLFTRIMQQINPDFRQIKPQGRIGDRKNDGFDKKKGVYYQVYAPENPSGSITQAVKKLEQDFQGLKDFWEEISPVKEYYFVFNDKYNGSYPKIEKALAKLGKQNPGLKAEPFYAKDLEDLFLQLPEEDILDIVGPIPFFGDVEKVEFSILAEVTDFLLKQPSVLYEELLVAPDFEEKIQFNLLSEKIAGLLKNGSYQIGALEKFFQSRGQFIKTELQNRFISLYTESHKLLDGKEKNNDLVFFRILEKALPKQQKAYQDAALVLMSYYFAACDIFEPPLGEDYDHTGKTS